MQKLVALFALIACVAMIEALPRTQLRYRPVARYQQAPRYNPRYAQYRYRPSRLVAEGEDVPEADVPVEVFADEAPVADVPELPVFPVEVPAAQEPLPVDDEVPLSASPDESFDHETRLLPEPEYRAAAPSGNFFPLRFDGGVNGGTVAVANSYSTGNRGKSESRAVAFGNPEAANRYRRRH